MAQQQGSDSKGTSSLKQKILFTLVCLAIYRIGVHIPTPGVDSAAVSEFFNSTNRGILGMFNTFSGGALSQFSIFALGVMPYISASIIFQLLTSAVPYLESLKKEGESGRKKINQYTRYATVLLAIIQGFGMSKWLSSQATSTGQQLISGGMVGPFYFQFVAIATLVAGTCFVMWLGDQITEKGIGNGTSLIIFTGIASSIPSGATKLFQLVSSNELSFALALMFIVYGCCYCGRYLYGSCAATNYDSVQRSAIEHTNDWKCDEPFANQNQFPWRYSSDFCQFFIDVSKYYFAVHERRKLGTSIKNWQKSEE